MLGPVWLCLQAELLGQAATQAVDFEHLAAGITASPAPCLPGRNPNSPAISVYNSSVNV